MTQNSSHDHISFPQSHDVRVSGLIVRPEATEPSYEERNPLLHGGATPLDPNLLQIGDKPYEAYCIDANNALVKELTDKYGLTEGQAERLSTELNTELTVRCGHNDDAMRTLRASLDAAPAGEDILEIIQRSREGVATTAELRKLIEHYPEMVAVNVADFLKPFDSKSHTIAAAADTRTARTIFKKQTSELTGVELIPETGALIVKRIIGRDDAKKSDTRMQMRMKQIFFATPHPDMPDLSNAPLSKDSIKNGIIWRILSTQAYFCVDDYKDQHNYHRERDALQVGQEEFIALYGLGRSLDR